MISFLPTSVYEQDLRRSCYASYGLLLLTVTFSIILVAMRYYARNREQLANTRAELSIVLLTASLG